MQNIKVSDLKKGDVFAESLKLNNREAFTVDAVINDEVFAMGHNSNKQKKFNKNQIKPIILLR